MSRHSSSKTALTLSSSRGLVVVLTALVSLAATVVYAQEDTAGAISREVKSIFERCGRAVVKIHAVDEHSELSGTGFFIDPAGTIYTSYSVGGEADNFTIQFEGKKYHATQLVADLRSGVALLRGVPVANRDLADIEKLYFGLSSYLGVVIAQNTKGDHVGHVKDEGLKWGQVSGGELVRGYRTNAYMPFHSDPTDRVALLCVQKAKRGGLSSIVSSTSLYNEILATHPEALDCLFRGFYYSLRGEGNGGIAQITDYRIPLFDYFAGKLSSRYVRKTIEQGAAVGGAPLLLLR